MPFALAGWIDIRDARVARFGMGAGAPESRPFRAGHVITVRGAVRSLPRIEARAAIEAVVISLVLGWPRLAPALRPTSPTLARG
jgi:hypothetical protein